MLSSIRERLVTAKRDRSRPLDTKLVQKLYGEFERAIAATPDPQGDPEIEDLLHVFALALMAVGMPRCTPAQYAILKTLERLLSHLELRPMFTKKEAAVCSDRLDAVHDVIGAPENTDLGVSAHVDNLVRAKLEKCRNSLNTVEALLGDISDDDNHLYAQAVHLRRDIFSALVEPDFSVDQLHAYREKLHQIQAHLHHTHHTPGAMLRHQLEACQFILGYFSNGVTWEPSMTPVMQELLRINRELAVCLATCRWTLRETDLYQYQVDMQRLDFEVLDFFHKVASGIPSLDAPIEELRHAFDLLGPYILAFFLVRKGHSVIYKLLDNAEPVTEALQPLLNQLRTTKRCLVDVRACGGISSLQELYPYQMKLTQLERLKTDGKFMVDDEVPPGQGILNQLLAECYDLVYELEVDLEERPSVQASPDVSRDVSRAGSPDLSPEASRESSVAPSAASSAYNSDVESER